MVNKICPLCESGHLVEQSYDDEIRYKNATGHISGFKYSVCNHCGAELTSAAQAKHNKLAVVNFKRTTDGVLTTDDIKHLLDRLKITASEASSVIGGGPVSFNKYLSGAVTPSQAVDSLLRLLYRRPELYQDLLEIQEERVSRPQSNYIVYHHLKDGLSSASNAGLALTKYQPEEMIFSNLLQRAPSHKRSSGILTKILEVLA